MPIRRTVDVGERDFVRRTQIEEEVCFIGQTEENVDGYSLVVRVVRLDRSGLRVRIETMKDGTVRHHFDTTAQLASRVLPFLEHAASLGGPVEALREASEWWASCSIQQVKDRAACMSPADAETLLSELNAAASLAENAVRLSKAAAQDVARASVIQAKRRAVKRVVHELRSSNHQRRKRQRSSNRSERYYANGSVRR